MKQGKDCTIYATAKIIGPENLVVGDYTIIDDFVLIVARPWVRLGSHVHIAGFTSIVGGGTFYMGDYSTLSWGTRIFTGTEDVSGQSLLGAAVPAPYRVPRRSFVTIGKHCMIGANSVILPAVEIPDGVVVGAMSLVLEGAKLKPWSVYAGCPVRFLRERPREKSLELEIELEQSHRPQ